MKVLLSLVLLALVAGTGLAAAPTVLCESSCTITASEAAFLGPVTVVASGASVSWVSLDIGHVNSDGPTGGGSCISHVSYNKASVSVPTRLTIVGGTLYGDHGTGPQPCGATELPDGSFALPYVCILHAPMRGVLLVK